MSDIARQLGITRGSVSIALRALKARELVQRFRQYEGDCPTDGNCAVCQGKCLLARLAEMPGVR